MTEIRMNIKKFDWILRNKLDEGKYFAVTAECVTEYGCNYGIARETEKAVLCTFNTEYGMVECWCPKSCLPFEEEVDLAKDQYIADKSILGVYELDGAKYKVWTVSIGDTKVLLRKMKKNGEFYAGNSGYRYWSVKFIKENMTKID